MRVLSEQIRSDIAADKDALMKAGKGVLSGTGSLAEYNSLLIRFNESLDRAADEIDRHMDDQPASWRESEEGQRYAEWKDAIEAAKVPEEPGSTIVSQPGDFEDIPLSVDEVVRFIGEGDQEGGPNSVKAIEGRVRRKAARLGWRIEKSRAKNLHSNNRGKWQLIDDTNTVREGADYEAELSDIEHWIDIELTRRAA